MKIGSLFSGYGGLEQGVQAVLGGTVAWHSEVDPGACKILAHRYPDVPNLGDITAVDWTAVDPVDVLTGGSPCQDVSSAGKRVGMRAGTRSGLWASMCDAIEIIRPRLVVWENVRGVLSAHADSAVEPCPICVGDERDAHLRALGRVVGDLDELGYVGRWVGLRAADVGAPHGRFRVFVAAWDAAGAARGGPQLRDLRARPLTAAEPGEPARPAPPHPADDGREWRGGARHGRSGSADHGDAAANPFGGGRERGRALQLRGASVDAAGDCARDVASHPEGHGRHEGWPESAWLVGGSDAAISGGAATADADGWGCEVSPELNGPAKQDPADRDPRRGHADGHPGPTDWGQYAPAIARWERLTRPAPAPTERNKNGQPRLSPAFVEWLMGLPAGWVTDVPGLTRNEQLKALGNGVVPAQCAAALRLLLPDAFEVAA